MEDSQALEVGRFPRWEGSSSVDSSTVAKKSIEASSLVHSRSVSRIQVGEESKRASFQHPEGKRRSLPYIVCLAIISLGTTFHIIGLTTTYWTIAKNITGVLELGLFQMCWGNYCGNYVKLSHTLEGIIVLPISETTRLGKQQMAGLILALFAVATSAFHLIMTCVGYKLPNFIPFLVGCQALAASITIILGVIAWLHQVHIPLRPSNESIETGYSLEISTTGGIFLLMGGLIYILKYFNKNLIPEKTSTDTKQSFEAPAVPVIDEPLLTTVETDKDKDKVVSIDEYTDVTADVSLSQA